MMARSSLNALVIVLICTLTLFSNNARAAVDSVTVVVSGANATAGKSIGTFAYDPNSDTMYVTSFGFSSSDGNAVMRKITNVSGVQVSTPMVSEAQQRLFYTDGVGGASQPQVGSPTQTGFNLNPKAIGLRPAYSFGVIVDQASVFPTSGTMSTANRIPAQSPRMYEYNLAAVPVGGDGRDVFTEHITLETLMTVAATTEKGDQFGGREFAWSGDGQSIYVNDAATNAAGTGGIWKVDATTWQPVRLLADKDINTDLAVTTSGNVDTIYFRGSATSSNAGGIDRITYDGTTLGARNTFVSGTAIRDFMENTTVPASLSLYMGADKDSNVYFQSGIAGRRGIYKVDPSGNVIKVMSDIERQSIGTGTAVTYNRFESRTTSFDGDGAGGNAPFQITQLLFADGNSDGVLGVNIFKPGDFNRDNNVTSADLALFGAKLSVRGGSSVVADDAKFDLNGNSIVDWKDVNVLQKFLPSLRTGDVNFDFSVNFDDLDIMSANYLGTGKTWVLGDIASRGTSSDFQTIDPLYTITGSLDKDIVNLTDLYAIANTWLTVLGQTRPTFGDLDSNGYTGQFRTDMILAFQIVPEPASALLLLTGVACVARVYRSRRKAA